MRTATTRSVARDGSHGSPRSSPGRSNCWRPATGASWPSRSTRSMRSPSTSRNWPHHIRSNGRADRCARVWPNSLVWPAILVTPQPHLLSAPSRLRRPIWVGAAVRGLPKSAGRSSTIPWDPYVVDAFTEFTARGGQSRRRIRAPRHPVAVTSADTPPSSLCSAHSQHTSGVHLAAVSVGEFRSFPCKYRTLPDATGPLSALSRRKPGFESR